MTAEEQKALDKVADRLGDLYQMVGRLQHAHALDATEILDETLALTEEVERISDRVRREADACH